MLIKKVTIWFQDFCDVKKFTLNLIKYLPVQFTLGGIHLVQNIRSITIDQYIRHPLP